MLSCIQSNDAHSRSCKETSALALSAVPVVAAVGMVVLTFLAIQGANITAGVYSDLSLGFSAVVLTFSLVNAYRSKQCERIAWLVAAVIGALFVTLFALSTANVISIDLPATLMLVAMLGGCLVTGTSLFYCFRR